MTTQPTFFGHADTQTRQPELFEVGGRVSALSCQECGRPMEETPSGYTCCPLGHGRLNLAFVEDEPCGLWFSDTEEG